MAVAHSQVPANPSYLTTFKKFMIAVPSLTLATNVTATALILWRVWRALSIRTVKRHVATVGHNTGQLRRLLEILIESGGLYCLTWLLLLCLIATGSPASHVFLSILGQLTVRYSLGSKKMGRLLTLDFFLWYREYTRLLSSYLYRSILPRITHRHLYMNPESGSTETHDIALRARSVSRYTDQTIRTREMPK